MKQYYWILLIVGAAPLLIYPFILLANVMSLAGTKSSTPVPFLQNLAATSFLWVSTLYPVAYAICAIAAVACSRSGNGSMALTLSAAPLAYLGLCVLLFMGWIAASP